MLKVENLTKKYPKFTLDNVSFEIPEGFITGFVGRNGAGKTTTLKSLLNLIRPDAGKVTFLGKDMYTNEVELKQKIGFMLGGVDYYSYMKVNTVAGVYGRFYKEWNESGFNSFLKKFNIDGGKRIRELSAGMKTKLGIAMALSHNARLLILDEPTSGLDPVARDELLDVFHKVVEDGTRSILFSTHITSDLDKCADYILILKNGSLAASDTKDGLIEKHAIVKGSLDSLTDGLKQRLIGLKNNQYGFSGLILKEKLNKSDNVQTETPNLEDMTIYYNQTGSGKEA